MPSIDALRTKPRPAQGLGRPFIAGAGLGIGIGLGILVGLSRTPPFRLPSEWPRLPAGQQALYVTLWTRFARPDGTTTAPAADIANALGVSSRTVRRHVAGLRTVGLVERRFVGGRWALFLPELARTAQGAAWPAPGNARRNHQ